jgi:Protein of unknown function (DUF2835)
MSSGAANVIYVPLTIGPDEYLRVYQGSAQNVFGYDVNGRSVSFPAKILQPFVTHDGISGLFAIQFNAAGKFLGIERVGNRGDRVPSH